VRAAPDAPKGTRRRDPSENWKLITDNSLTPD
jgi:hypothetical protein